MRGRPGQSPAAGVAGSGNLGRGGVPWGETLERMHYSSCRPRWRHAAGVREPRQQLPLTTAPAGTATQTSVPTLAPTSRPDYLVVAIGDSIPFNSPDDCPGCRGFVDQYGMALGDASNKSVGVVNLSKHTGLTVDELLRDLERNQGLLTALADADVIIVGIAHNDVPMARDDDSCDGAGGETPDWSKFTDACLQRELDRFRPSYEAVFEKVAELRAGKPTILRAINRYNDWIGWPGNEPPAAGIEATSRVIAAWNEMICTAAVAEGFLCADIAAEFNGHDGTQPAATSSPRIHAPFPEGQRPDRPGSPRAPDPAAVPVAAYLTWTGPPASRAAGP